MLSGGEQEGGEVKATLSVKVKGEGGRGGNGEVGGHERGGKRVDTRGEEVGGIRRVSFSMLVSPPVFVA